MKIKAIILLLLTLMFTISCRHVIEKEITNYQYFDVLESDTLGKTILFAITGEKHPQYGSKVAYVNGIGDTIIPFGKFAYYGSDSLVYYANVMEYNGKEYGRKIAINRKQEVTN